MSKHEEIKALIVDDLPEARADIKDHLDILGHLADEADCYEEARDLLGRNSYDYVVLDLQLPIRKGSADKIEVGKNLLDEIIANHAYTGIVVVTAHAKTFSHVVDVMGRSPLVGYVPKPFTDEPGNPTLTAQIREVLAKAQKYKEKQWLPCPQSPSIKEHQAIAIGTIDLTVVKLRKNVQKFILFDGEAHPVAYREYEILKLYAIAQAEIPNDPDRHLVPLHADAFNIPNDYNNRHSAISRLRSKILKYLPDGHEAVLQNTSDGVYFLNCYCVTGNQDKK